MNNELNNTSMNEDIEVIDIPEENNTNSNTYELDYTNNIEINKRKHIHKGLIIGIIFAIIGIAGVLAYYFISNDPTNYYKCLSKVLVDKIYSATNYNSDIYTQSIDIDVNLTTDSLDADLFNIINDTKLGIKLGVDKKNKQSSISIDSTYKNDSLIDASLYLDEKNNKSYVYLNNYLDKYIELDSNTIGSTGNTLNNSAINTKKAKKIIQKEIMKQIKSSETSKKDGYLVYTTTNIELVNKVKIILTNLSENKNFLDCYSNPKETKNTLSKLIYFMNNTTFDEEVEIKFYAKKRGLLDHNLKEFIIESESKRLTFDVSKNITKYSFSRDNNVIFSGTYSSTGKDDKNIVLTLDIPDLLTFEMKINNKYEKAKFIKFVDKNKVTKINELTEQDKLTIMNKLSESKLYSFISNYTGDISTDNESTKIRALAYIDEIEAYAGFYDAKQSGISLNGYDTPIPKLANIKSKYIKCIKNNGSWIGGATGATCNMFFNAIDSISKNKIEIKDGSVIYLTTEGKVVYNSVFKIDDYTCKYDGKDIECTINMD